MKVVVDFTAGVRQPAGVGRYTRSLVKALAEAGTGAISQELEQELVLLWAGPALIPPPAGWPRTRSQRLPLPERWMRVAWHRLRLPVAADVLAGGCDVFYSPDFTLPPLLRARSVVTVHDLSFVTHPDTHLPSLRTFLEKVVPRAVRRADLVLADSEQTKRDLLSWLDLSPQKVVVVPAAADAVFRRVDDHDDGWRETLQRRGIDRPYVLSVGTVQPRKNLPAIAKALRQTDRDLLLVHVGRPGWLCERVFEAVQKTGLGDRVRYIGDADDAELAMLYSRAVAFAFPSLYEGFGLPCLEAMACGCPVIASHAGSLAEVVGDAGVAVDPLDTAAIAAGIRRLQDDLPFREALVCRGYAQTARFRWETSGVQLRQLLERVAK